jgi:hypothetical protein
VGTTYYKLLEAQSSKQKNWFHSKGQVPGTKMETPSAHHHHGHCSTLLAMVTSRYSELNFGFSSPRQLIGPLQVATQAQHSRKSAPLLNAAAAGASSLPRAHDVASKIRGHLPKLQQLTHS